MKLKTWWHHCVTCHSVLFSGGYKTVQSCISATRWTGVTAPVHVPLRSVWVDPWWWNPVLLCFGSALNSSLLVTVSLCLFSSHCDHGELDKHWNTPTQVHVLVAVVTDVSSDVVNVSHTVPLVPLVSLWLFPGSQINDELQSQWSVWLFLCCVLLCCCLSGGLYFLCLLPCVR